MALTIENNELTLQKQLGGFEIQPKSPPRETYNFDSVSLVSYKASSPTISCKALSPNVTQCKESPAPIEMHRESPNVTGKEITLPNISYMEKAISPPIPPLGRDVQEIDI